MARTVVQAATPPKIVVPYTRPHNSIQVYSLEPTKYWYMRLNTLILSVVQHQVSKGTQKVDYQGGPTDS